MSAAEAEAEEEPADATEGEQADPDDGRPAINEDEMADLDAVREEVAEETTPPESDDDGDSADDADTTSEESAAGGDDLDTEGDTVGDFYVSTLVSTSNMLIEEHGREGADEIDGAFLRQMDVDDAVDELLADDGGPDLPPEQQVLLGTAMFGVAVLATKTTVIDDALESADFSLQ